MKNSVKITTGLFAALAATTPFECPPATTVTVTVDSGAASPNAPTSDPNSFMTISIDNAYGSHLSLSLDVDKGSAPPVGNPSPTTIAPSSSTQYTFPTGWAGRIVVGPSLNPNGTKIEGSYTGPPDIDVSYVDGFSVPITCSSEGTVVSGCNINLFEQGTCENLAEGHVCLNPARVLADGPATSFFAVCAGAAYTFPNDNVANAGGLGSNVVSCCIGTSCKAHSRQSSLQAQPSEPVSPSTVLVSTTVSILRLRPSGPMPPYPLAPSGSWPAGKSGSAPVLSGRSSSAPPYPTSSPAGMNSAVSRYPLAGTPGPQAGPLPSINGRRTVTTTFTSVI